MLLISSVVYKDTNTIISFFPRLFVEATFLTIFQNFSLGLQWHTVV